MKNIDKSKTSIKDTLGIILWTQKLFIELVPDTYLILIITQLLASTLPFAANRLFSELIDNLVSLSFGQLSGWKNTFIALFFIRLLMNLNGYFRSLTNRISNITLDNELRKKYLFKISSLDFQQHEDKKISNLIAKSKDEYQWRIRQILSDTNDFLGQIISFATVTVILFPKYWYIAIFLFLSQIPQFLNNKKWSIIDWNFFNQSSEKNRQGWDISFQLTTKKYLAELKINDSIKFLQSKLTEIADNFNYGRIKIRKAQTTSNVVLTIWANITITVSLLVLINDIRLGALTIGLFNFYFNAIRQVDDLFSGFSSRFISIAEQVRYINDFRNILDIPNIVKNGSTKLDFKKPPIIELQNLSFKYPGTKRYVFRNFNLKIHSGEEIAIVGVNGAGKTTLIKLLCRYYDPVEGQILINGTNLKDLDIQTWYQNLSVLFQEFTTYPNLTLRENVSVSKPDKTSDIEIVDSLKKSEAHTFTKKYPNGLDTVLSQRYGGEEPSWGQWQKIAIARIFYRNTSIMILDEPTASIDAVSEYKIFSRLYKSVKNKTVIIVSHRFSTVRNAQRIIVIDKGKIVEEGTHSSLIELDGKYAQSFKLQAEGYN